MTANDFRSLALSFPEASEEAHMGHPDFRVGGKIFATLGPNEDWGMVKLTPTQQTSVIDAEPDVYHPASGAWGRRGCTIVRLGDADDSRTITWTSHEAARRINPEKSAPTRRQPWWPGRASRDWHRRTK